MVVKGRVEDKAKVDRCTVRKFTAIFSGKVTLFFGQTLKQI